MMITNTNQSEANQGTILHITAYHSNGKGKHSKDEHRGAIDFLGDFREPRATRDRKAKQGNAENNKAAQRTAKQSKPKQRSISLRYLRELRGRKPKHSHANQRKPKQRATKNNTSTHINATHTASHQRTEEQLFKPTHATSHSAAQHTATTRAQQAKPREAT